MSPLEKIEMSPYNMQSFNTTSTIKIDKKWCNLIINKVVM